MNASLITGFLVGLALGAIVLFMIAKPSKGPSLTDPNPTFQKALEEQVGVPASADMLQPVYDLFANYSETSISEHATKVYAPTLYFRDGFKELTSAQGIHDYMLHGVQPVRTCTFQFEPPAIDGADVYLRWVMNLNLKKDPEDKMLKAIGLSHLRFNAEGQVIFQQDYWDPTDVLYGQIPVSGFMVDQVRKRL